MRNKIVIFFFFFLFFSGFFLIWLHASYNAKTIGSNKITIVTTTTMVTDIVNEIARDRAIVHGLMGPGIDPHLYRARESDVHKLGSADIVFYNGLHLEGKMANVLEGMNRFTRTVAVTRDIDRAQLRSVEFCMYDPHVWFDVELWSCAVQTVCDELVQLDPDNAQEYKNNNELYQQRLTDLNEYIKNKVAAISRSHRIFVTAHDAFGYFGNRYGFDVVGLQGLSTDAEIGVQDIVVLADLIVEKKIPVLFAESSISQRSVIALCNAVSARGHCVTIGPELYSDALGDISTPAHDYCGMMRYTVDVLIDSLKR